MIERINGYLVCGGDHHDFDFVRRELLSLLGEDDRIRTRVGSDFHEVEAIADSHFLVTYTCNVRPSESEQDALAAWVAAGGRWLALHATNAAVRFTRHGVECPRAFPRYADLLGSQFLAHPPRDRFTVSPADGEHPLVAGLEPFETVDELYLSEYHGELIPLLTVRWGGTAPGFIESDWPTERDHYTAYLRPYQEGCVYYLTLGHCHGHYDLQPYVEWQEIERCSWEVPVYYELLRRGIAWAARVLTDPKGNAIELVHQEAT